MNVYYLKRFRKKAKKHIKARYRTVNGLSRLPFEIFCNRSDGTYAYQVSNQTFRTWNTTEEELVKNLRLARIQYILDLVKVEKDARVFVNTNLRLEKL